MNLHIAGDAYVLTSTLSVEEIKTVKKYNPSALKIQDKDGNDVFAMSYVPGKPSVSKCGVTFGGEARDGSGKATITGTIPSDVANAKEFVAELVGAALTHINALEGTIPAVAAELKAQKDALIGSITIS